jgi:hypothetical protein
MIIFNLIISLPFAKRLEFYEKISWINIKNKKGWLLLIVVFIMWLSQHVIPSCSTSKHFPYVGDAITKINSRTWLIPAGSRPMWWQTIKVSYEKYISQLINTWGYGFSYLENLLKDVVLIARRKLKTSRYQR